MANYKKTTVGSENRTELHEKLSLTGAEISLNQLPAGASVPFVHAHKENEEIYGVLSGKGKAVIDGEEIGLFVGDWLKIPPRSKAPVLCRTRFRDFLHLHPGEGELSYSFYSHGCRSSLISALSLTKRTVPDQAGTVRPFYRDDS